jgi:hypothetical protein
MDLHRPTGAWYFRGLHQARAFTIGIILKFELLSVRFMTTVPRLALISLITVVMFVIGSLTLYVYGRSTTSSLPLIH